MKNVNISSLKSTDCSDHETKQGKNIVVTGPVGDLTEGKCFNPVTMLTNYRYLKLNPQSMLTL